MKKLCVKKPIPYKYQKNTTNQPIIINDNLEAGTQSCEPGDYIMTGIKGERWVLLSKTFDDIYDCWDDMTAIPKLDIRSFEYVQEPGELVLAWGEKGSLIPVSYSEEHVLIERKIIKDGQIATTKYPCKKDIFKKSYLTASTEEEVQALYNNLHNNA